MAGGYKVSLIHCLCVVVQTKSDRQTGKHVQDLMAIMCIRFLEKSLRYFASLEVGVVLETPRMAGHPSHISGAEPLGKFLQPKNTEDVVGGT